jgi:hypothetical protein
MTFAAKEHIAQQIFGTVRYERVRRVILIGLGLMAGCNQIVGFKDPKLEGDGGNGSGSDGSVGDGGIDMAIDAPPANLFIFVTDAGFIGGFGAANGARQTADIKCQDKYTASFPALGCTQIHAFIQVDDTVDTLARFKITFNTVPLTTEIKRATADRTPVSPNIDSLVNPNAQLLAAIAPGTTTPLFWSGRGVTANLQCNNWTSSQTSVQGNAGDVTTTNAWTSQANVTCNNFDEHFVCVCW